MGYQQGWSVWVKGSTSKTFLEIDEFFGHRVQISRSRFLMVFWWSSTVFCILHVSHPRRHYVPMDERSRDWQGSAIMEAKRSSVDCFFPKKICWLVFFSARFFLHFWTPVWFPTGEGMISTTKHGDELNMRRVGSHYPHAFQNTFGSQREFFMGMIFQQTREKCTLLGCASQMEKKVYDPYITGDIPYITGAWSAILLWMEKILHQLVTIGKYEPLFYDVIISG